MFDQFFSRACAGLCSFLFILPVFSVFAETITFENVLSASLENSFDVKVVQENIKSARASVREAKAEYYPHLSVRFSNDYIHSYTDGERYVAGTDVVVATESSYRHSLISTLRYTLFDFGVRANAVEISHHQVNIANLQERQAYWDIRREVLLRYAKGLQLQKSIAATESILERQNQIFRLARELRLAGSYGREQIGVAALDLAESLNQLDDLKIDLQNVLFELTYYTQQNYDAKRVNFSDFEQLPVVDRTIDLNAVPKVQIYQQQIASKKAELEMLTATMLPKLMLYGSHRMFGSDPDSFSQSFSSLRARDATLSIVIELPLFSGFADTAKRARINHEISSLRYQKMKTIAELQKEADSTIDTYHTRHAAEQARQQQLQQIDLEQNDAAQLAEHRVTDQIKFHRKMIELMRKQLDQSLWRVDYAAAALAARYMNEVVQ